MKLVIVVEGVDVPVSVDERMPLHCVVPPALLAQKNTGPVDVWELRAADGTLLATTPPISAFGFKPGTRLLLDRPAIRERDEARARVPGTVTSERSVEIAMCFRCRSEIPPLVTYFVQFRPAENPRNIVLCLACANDVGRPPDGSHADEQGPRDATWHKERANWTAETNCLRVALDSSTVENRKLRELLFVGHGCGGAALYGDDGELQDNSCGIDFRRDSAADIEARIVAHGINQLAEHQAAKDASTVENERLRRALKKLANGFQTRGGCCGICGAGEDETCGKDCGAQLARDTLKSAPTAPGVEVLRCAREFEATDGEWPNPKKDALLAAVRAEFAATDGEWPNPKKDALLAAVRASIEVLRCARKFAADVETHGWEEADHAPLVAAVAREKESLK